jgi:sigma-B regulation protein RsbU (phosphoserine phosphatase)
MTASPHSQDRLALLYRVSQAFNSSLELEAVLTRVMDEIIAITRAERGFIMLLDSAGQLRSHIARGLDQGALAAPAFQVSRGIVERVAREGRPLLTSDAQSDDWLRSRASVMTLGLRAILCVPLQLKDQIIGVVYVDSRIQAGIFTPADLELLTAIAASAAVAIENARLYQLAVDKGRLERELQVAREVQAGLLPRQVPQLPGWDIAARWRPAREVAGDFYDFIPASAGALGLVVADVTDKGMPAALFMALTRTTVRTSLAGADSPTGAARPAEGLAHANRLICADSPNDMFVTLAYILVQPDSGDVVCVNAGHNPVLVRHADGRYEWLWRTGLPLGVLAESTFSPHAIQVAPGDLILMYTDGLTDALDAAGRELGLERAQAVMAENASASAAEIVAALEQMLDAHIGGAAPFDDITLLLAKRL